MHDYPLVTKYMTSKLITFTPETDIYKAIDTMLKARISGAPVVDKDRKLVGMLSEVDCLKILLEGPYNQEPSRKGTVSSYMTTDLITIGSNKTIADAAYVFAKQGIKRLPVLEDGELTGQISRSDVLRAIKSLGPKIKHVPDSWRGRVPDISKHKDTHYTKNS